MIKAAASNKSVFFHQGGAPKSVRKVYDWAMKQTGGAGTVRIQDVGTPPLIFDKARLTVAKAQDARVQMLLASVMNWQPKHSAFSSLFGNQDKATPSSAMSFSPGLRGLLSDAKGAAR
ncbi:MAG: hypothetical protein NTX21_12185 [Alphaproteobacteria bacterium]|nr:hypothetical protein [Alphaproteobacteria bacterium]